MERWPPGRWAEAEAEAEAEAATTTLPAGLWPSLDDVSIMVRSITTP